MASHPAAIGSPGTPPSQPPPRAMVDDVLRLRRALAQAPLPPGIRAVNPKGLWRARHDVLNLLLEGYYRHGSVFSLQILWDPMVMMVGPEANHFMLVSGRKNFAWRHGRMGDLWTLLGDGLLTTDGDYHDASRAVMMPAFHRERVARSVEVMVEEAAAEIERLEVGATIDIYHWTQALAMRIAMRALFGFEAGSTEARETAHWFEQGLDYHGKEYLLQTLVGPRTPWARLKRARAELERLVGTQVTARRRSGEDRGDVLSSLLAASGEGGARLTDRQVLDHVITLLFAGHDTTTATVSFLAHELAHNPDWFERLGSEIDDVVGPDAAPRAEQVFGELPLQGQAIDETLRLYPPAWIGPRRSVRSFTHEGVTVPADINVAYSSWVSHHLPDVWEQPEEFRPQRFTPEARAKLPRGAYVPFGMGPRVCIGKRFGYTEVQVIAAMLLRRFRWEPVDRELVVNQVPTLTPKGGLPVRLADR